MSLQTMHAAKLRQYKRALEQLVRDASHELEALEAGKDTSSGLGGTFNDIFKIYTEVKLLEDMVYDCVEPVSDTPKDLEEKPAPSVFALPGDAAETMAEESNPPTSTVVKDNTPILLKGSQAKKDCISFLLERNFKHCKTMQDLKDYCVPVTPGHMKEFIVDRLHYVPAPEGTDDRSWETELTMQAVRMACEGNNFWIAAKTTLAWIESKTPARQAA